MYGAAAPTDSRRLGLPLPVRQQPEALFLTPLFFFIAVYLLTTCFSLSLSLSPVCFLFPFFFPYYSLAFFLT